MKINVRDVIKMSLSDITVPEYKDVIFEIVYDDGVVESDAHLMSLDIILYGVLRPYMGTEYEPKFISKALSITSMDIITDSGITDILSYISESIKLLNVYDNNFCTDIDKIVYKVDNDLYNFMHDKQEYMYAFCYIDLVRAVYDPDIDYVNKNLRLLHDDPEIAVGIAQKEVKRIILEKPIRGYKNEPNNFAMAIQNNLAPTNQSLQLITAIGKRSDIDGTIMSKVIPKGYGGQLSKIEDIFIDSRNSSIALFMQKEPLKDVQYLNRRTTTASMYIRTHHGIDCGNRATLSREVTEADKWAVLGKWMLCEDGSWKAIMENMLDDLVGTTVKIRSLIRCLNKNRQTKCRMCYGMLSANIPSKTNIGGVSAEAVGVNNTQNTLAVKHSIESAVTGAIHIVGEAEKRYLEVNKNKMSISLSAKISSKRKVFFKLKHDSKSKEDPLTEKGSLLDLVYNQNESTAINFDTINPHNVLSFSVITIVICDGTGKAMKEEDLYVRTGSRDASFSIDALKFILSEKDRINIDAKGCITIDFTGFKRGTKLFVYRKKMDSFLDYSYALEEIITSSGSSNNYQGFPIHHLSKFDNCDDAVNYLCDFFNIKNRSSIVHAEVIVNAFLCKDPKNGNYNLPDPGQDGVIVGFEELMRSCSMSSSMSNGYHLQALTALPNYLRAACPEEVRSHPFDNMLMG